MFVWAFLLRITHTIISQSIADSSSITLYITPGFSTKDSEFSRQLYLGSPHDSSKQQIFPHAAFPDRSF